MRRIVLLGALALACTVVGCMDSSPPGSTPSDPEDADEPAVEFTDPIELTSADVRGFEPSIEVGPTGTIYVTAHKSNRIHEGSNLSSLLWYSTDDGRTWSTVPSPQGVHQRHPGQEATIATDGRGWLYFLDTYLGDMTLTRWSPGPTWEDSRQVTGTSGLDDRPWLEAVGEGRLYLLSANGGQLPSPRTVTDDPGTQGRFWFYRSTDAGLTWSPGRAFGDSEWCGVSASLPQPDRVHVGCSTSTDTEGDGTDVTAWWSYNGGEDWLSQRIGHFQQAPSEPFPIATASDDEGRGYHAWIDEDWSDEIPGRVAVGWEVSDGQWATANVTPFEGSFGMPWIAADAPGTVAVVFYGANTTTPQNGGADWFPYVALGTDLDTGTPGWSVTRLMDRPVDTDAAPPLDFFQADMGDDGVVHVVFGADDHPPCAPGDACVDSRNADSTWYVRQEAGPNVESS